MLWIGVISHGKTHGAPIRVLAQKGPAQVDEADELERVVTTGEPKNQRGDVLFWENMGSKWKT